MNSTTAAASTVPAFPPLQLVHIEINPIVGGTYAAPIEATLLEEERLEFVGEDLAHQRVGSLDEVLAVIRQALAHSPLAAKLFFDLPSPLLG